MRASILPPRPGNLRLIRKSALRPFAGGKSLLLLEQLVVGDEEEADSIVIPASWVIGTVFEGVHP
jgi:hypothetical protein